MRGLSLAVGAGLQGRVEVSPASDGGEAGGEVGEVGEEGRH